MTDTEWIAKLEADFGKLQRNRQQVPLEKLETTYAKSYKALISRLTEAADWFADRYLQTAACSKEPKAVAVVILNAVANDTGQIIIEILRCVGAVKVL